MSNESSSLVKHAPVHYYDEFLSKEEADALFKELCAIKAEKHNYKASRLKRKMAVFTTDQRRAIPEIWGDNVSIEEFSPHAVVALDKVSRFLKKEFNVCLVNVYETGKDSIGWHSDNEEKGDVYCIASISLGAERTFSMSRKTSFQPADDDGEEEERVEVKLKHGSLLVMNFPCQERYLHAVLPEKSVLEKRINLTFRTFHYENVEQ